MLSKESILKLHRGTDCERMTEDVQVFWCGETAEKNKRRVWFCYPKCQQLR